jgi:hypothetical protein
MCFDFAARRYSFRFHPGKQFEFETPDLSGGLSSTFPCPQEAASCLLCGSLQAGLEEPVDTAKPVCDFPALFSDKLGTVKGMVCHQDLTDTVPVRSKPYQCSPPRAKLLREIVQVLLDKGVVRRSYSQYANPAFLVPKPGGGQRMVTDYRLLNKKSL